MAASKGFPILFIASSRIGDAVLASGLIKRLHDEIPAARFTIVAGPLSAPLFADTPNLSQLIVMDKTKGGGHWFKLWSRVRGRNWGLIVDRRGSSVARFLRAKRRAIHRTQPGEPVHKVIDLTETGDHDEPELALVKVAGVGEHRVEALRIADVFRAKVVDTTTHSFVFELTGAPEKIDRFVAIMRELGLVEVGRTGIVGMMRGPEAA